MSAPDEREVGSKLVNSAAAAALLLLLLFPDPTERAGAEIFNRKMKV